MLVVQSSYSLLLSTGYGYPLLAMIVYILLRINVEKLEKALTAYIDIEAFTGSNSENRVDPTSKDATYNPPDSGSQPSKESLLLTNNSGSDALSPTTPPLADLSRQLKVTTTFHLTQIFFMSLQARGFARIHKIDDLSLWAAVPWLGILTIMHLDASARMQDLLERLNSAPREGREGDLIKDVDIGRFGDHAMWSGMSVVVPWGILLMRLW